MYLDCLRQLAADRDVGPALIADGAAISRAVLWAEVEALAGWLHGQGLRRGDVVGLTVRSEYPHLRAALASMRLGCAHVILPSFESQAYRHALAARAGVRAHLVEDARFASAHASCIVLPTSPPPSPAADLPDVAGDAPCTYFVSSGTTGRPKIIPLSERQLREQALNWRFFGRGDRFWRPTAIEFNNSKRHRLYALAVGACNVFADANGVTLAEIVDRHAITCLDLTVVQARRLVDEVRATGRRLPAGCRLRVSGSMVASDLRSTLQAVVTGELQVGYATSEFGAVSSAGPDQCLGGDSVGVPHPGVDLAVVDAAGRPLPPGQTGRVQLRGPGMATHYLGDAEASAAAFQDGWFIPGDVGWQAPDGQLHLVGRADEMMSLASINIFPSEIESAFAGYPGVVECAAFALKSAHFGDVPVLAVVSDQPVDADRMLRLGRDRLGLRAPRKVFRVESLPRNSGGKVDRVRLRELLERQWRGS